MTRAKRQPDQQPEQQPYQQPDQPAQSAPSAQNVPSAPEAPSEAAAPAEAVAPAGHGRHSKRPKPRLTRPQRVFRLMALLLIVIGLAYCLMCVLVAVPMGILHASGLVMLDSSAEYNTLTLNIINIFLAEGLVFVCGMTSFRAPRHPRMYAPAIVMLCLCCGIQVMSFALDFRPGALLPLAYLFAMLLLARYLKSKAEESAAYVEPAAASQADAKSEVQPMTEPEVETGSSKSQAPAAQPSAGKRGSSRPAVRRVLSSLGFVLLAGVVFCLLHVAGHTVTGRYLVTQPVSYLEAAEADADGAIRVTSTYASEAQDSSKTTPEMEIVWRDDWFDQPSTSYNHELATAAMALSVLANSEAHYYTAQTATACLEDCLTQLGFTDIDTSSYYSSSETLDEIGRIFNGKTDVVAFGLGRKELPATGSTDGSADDTRTLVVCAVRGTWGSEWLSNLRVKDADGSTDTAGFADAADLVLAAIEKYTADLDPERTVVLIVGHSRGGSVSNIVGARLDELAGTSDEVAPRDSIYVYGFAVSGTTLSTGASDELYDNIFSVQVPGDLVPEVPLRSWGFTRYGVELRFPGEDSAGYEELIARVQEHAEQNIGQELSIDFYMADNLRELLDALAARFSSASEVTSLTGGVGFAGVAAKYNVAQIIKYHYPDYYLALMESTEADDLVLVSDGGLPDATA